MRDGTNTKRTTITYDLVSATNISIFGLPSEVITYKADLSTAAKRVEYEYNFSSNYIDRRIIGLPSEVRTYGWDDGTSGEQYTSRTTYAFDESGYTGTGQSLSSATQHDATNFGTAFAYRGNLTGVTRWDTTQPTTSGAAITSSTVYDIAGSPVARLDPLNRKVAINYADNFNSTGNPATFAYPTTLTDPANNSSTVKYRYDTGANVRAQSPAPAGQTQGKITEREYDSIGRLLKDKIANYGGAYTRYEYP
ncbi:MAG: hypothetical protein ACT4O9_09300, partial [Blastocatellia bacterium]